MEIRPWHRLGVIDPIRKEPHALMQEPQNISRMPQSRHRPLGNAESRAIGQLIAQKGRLALHL